MSKESALAMAKAVPASTQATAAPITPQPIATKVPVETPIVEKKDPTPVATSATETPVDDKRLSILIKKEADLFKQREAINKDKTDLATKAAEYDRVINRIKEFETTAKTDKVAALKMLGWTDTDIVNAMNAEPGQVNAAEEARKIALEEVGKIRKELTEKEQKEKSDRDVSLVNNFKADISKTIKEKADKYEFCALEGAEAERLAYHMVDQNLRINKELITIDEALDMVEEVYEQKYRAAQKLKKLQPVTEAVAEPTTTAEVQRGQFAGRPPVSNTPQPAAQPAARPRTLTNAVTPTAASTTNNAVRETPEAKRARLADAIRQGGLRKSA